jgi:hypothetical protein
MLFSVTHDDTQSVEPSLTNVIEITAGEARMVHSHPAMFDPSPIMYLFGAFYAVFAVAVIRHARKSSCRICLHRRGCPSRRSAFAGRGGVPCFERGIEEPELYEQTVTASDLLTADSLTGWRKI